MSKGSTIFEQLQALLSRSEFACVVSACRGDYKVHVASCWSHLNCMFLILLMRCSSLMDFQTSVQNRRTFLQRLGIGSVDDSTVSYANNHRPWQVMMQVFVRLYQQCRVVSPAHRFRFKGPLFLLDATEMDTCASLFAWARISPTQSGVKMHMGLDHHGLIPNFVTISSMRESELTQAKILTFLAGTVLCFDRGYFSSTWLHDLTKQGCVFVTRWRAGTQFKVLRKQHPTTSKGVVRDLIIQLTGQNTSANYPGQLRLIEFYHAETKKTYYFLTNQMTWSDVTICQIYKSRWKIETFFRWIKAHLKIKSFFGYTLNAVRWQLLTALCIYLLLAYLKFKAMTDLSLFQIFSKLEKHLFEKTNIQNLLNGQYQFQT